MQKLSANNDDDDLQSLKVMKFVDEVYGKINFKGICQGFIPREDEVLTHQLMMGNRKNQEIKTWWHFGAID